MKHLLAVVCAVCVVAGFATNFDPQVGPRTGTARVTGLGSIPGENARAVQAALDDCARTGGGRVDVPPGVWTCGTIRLRSGVELHLPKGAVLRASPDLADYNGRDEYPENWACPSEGWSARHFIIGHRVEGASITGEGMVDGSADAFFEGEPFFTPHTKIVWANGIRRKKDMRPADSVRELRLHVSDAGNGGVLRSTAAFGDLLSELHMVAGGGQSFQLGCPRQGSRGPVN